MSQTAPPASRSRRLALAALCAAMLMVILDGSIVRRLRCQRGLLQEKLADRAG